jgi:DnaJ-domain-containing protein 1
MNYIWIILLAIYIISPFDAHPLVIDDLIAAGVMFYMMFKNAKRKQQQQQYYNYSGKSRANQSQQNRTAESHGPLTLDEAYRLLGVTPNISLDEISKAYKEKMIKSHPDKVSHLSEELQEKAKELTLDLNAAYDLIKKHKKG